MAVRVQPEDFDLAAEIAALTAGRTDIGALVTFTGLVRRAEDQPRALLRQVDEPYRVLSVQSRKPRSDADLEIPRKLQRRAQFMLDFIEAENSTGFHAPEEAERVLAESIDYARQGQLVLRGAKVPGLMTAKAVKPVPADVADR